MIVNNPLIKKALIERWRELDLLKNFDDNQERLSHKEIVADARDRAPDMKITSDRLSRYLKDNHAGLSESQIWWLCTRWGVFLSLTIGAPKIKEDGKLIYEVPKYDELECLRRLKQLEPLLKHRKPKK